MDNDRDPTSRALSRAAAACHFIRVVRVVRLSCAMLVAGGLAACATAPSEATRAETGAAAAIVADAPASTGAAPAEAAPTPAVVPADAPAPNVAETARALVELPPIDEASNVFFASRSAWIDAAGQQKLRDIAERLAGNRRATVLLIGHSDAQGSRSYNLAITEERLEAVGKLLRSYGVAAHQLRRNRVGSIRRAADCNDEACWRQARRVELVVTP